MSCDASHRKMTFRSNSRCLIARMFALALFAFAGLSSSASRQLHAQSLPATAPTALPAKNALPAPIVASPDVHTTTPKPAAHRATVTYASGMLDVHADNSSLNQILREVSRLTGMKITGGVADERVFGNYGPAEPSTILATLLDGTGSNMVLRETADNVPAELVLTPRSGGATPPNPNAPGFDDGPDDDAVAGRPAVRSRGAFAGRALGGGPQGPGALRSRVPAPQDSSDGNTATPQLQPNSTQVLATPATLSTPASIPQPLNNINGSAANTSPTASTYPTTNSVPTDSLPTPSTTPDTDGIVDAPNTPPPGGTTAGSLTPTGNVEVPATAAAGTATGGTVPNPAQPAANTPATPEQIFQQLQALRKQQSGSSTPASSTTPAPQ